MSLPQHTAHLDRNSQRSLLGCCHRQVRTATKTVTVIFSPRLRYSNLKNGPRNESSRLDEADLDADERAYFPQCLADPRLAEIYLEIRGKIVSTTCCRYLCSNSCCAADGNSHLAEVKM